MYGESQISFQASIQVKDPVILRLLNYPRFYVCVQFATMSTQITLGGIFINIFSSKADNFIL